MQCPSREVEAPDALAHRDMQLLAHDPLGAVLGQLQVVHARHHARQIVVRSQRRLVWLPDYCERRVEALEA